jgi:hypothetical protein
MLFASQLLTSSEATYLKKIEHFVLCLLRRGYPRSFIGPVLSSPDLAFATRDVHLKKFLLKSDSRKAEAFAYTPLMLIPPSLSDTSEAAKVIAIVLKYDPRLLAVSRLLRKRFATIADAWGIDVRILTAWKKNPNSVKVFTRPKLLSSGLLPRHS